MPIINVKKSKRCAFCTNWDDKSNELIRLDNDEYNLWDYDNSTFRMCCYRNEETKASSYCNGYNCKVELK